MTFAVYLIRGFCIQRKACLSVHVIHRLWLSLCAFLKCYVEKMFFVIVLWVIKIIAENTKNVN